MSKRKDPKAGGVQREPDPPRGSGGGGSGGDQDADSPAELAAAMAAFDELAGAFDDADAAIEAAFGEERSGGAEAGAARAAGARPVAARAGAEPSAEDLLDGATVEMALDDIFASFEEHSIDSAVEEEAAAEARTRTRSREADRRIEQVVASLVRLLVSKREVSRRDLDIVFEITKTKLVEAIHAEAVTIFLARPDGIQFAHVAYSSSLWKGNPKEEQRLKQQAERLKGTTLPPGTGIVGKVLADGRPYTTMDAPRDQFFYAQLSRSVGFPVRTMMTVPIRHDDHVYGAIQLINKNPASGEQFFSQSCLRLAEEVAEYSARAIYMADHPGHEWPPEELSRYVARLAKVEYVDLTEHQPDPKLLQLLGEEALAKFRIVPLKKLGTRAIKACIDNPLDLARRDAFQLATDLVIEVLVVAPETQIRAVIDKAFPKGGVANELRDQFLQDLADKQTAREAERVHLAPDAKEDSAPVIKLVNSIIEDAYARGSSDIHIEPFEKEVLVRYRTDGVLHEVMRLPRDAARSLTARLKIMASLDIAESRLPQDGRIRFKDFSRSGVDVDLRVATGPMIWGEKTVMRLLDKSAATVGVEKLGYSDKNLAMYMECVEAPYGMILHTGPTGSGKTTSLYAALAYCNKPDMNIQTAEDPVEYVMQGINQMEMRPLIGLTFARALKCYLRQDPDIILVGEIRDLETGSIAIEAALTGHQVFSTLHTNDAAGTITRLVEMGIEPFLITGSLLCVCAQRLARRLCGKCKVPHRPDAAEREMLKVAPGEEVLVHTAKEGGCAHCNGAGYKGRLGIHELLVMNEPVRAIAARHGVTASDIHRVAVAEAGLVSLFDDAMLKVRLGHTDLAEALRNVKQM